MSTFGNMDSSSRNLAESVTLIQTLMSTEHYLCIESLATIVWTRQIKKMEKNCRQSCPSMRWSYYYHNTQITTQI